MLGTSNTAGDPMIAAEMSNQMAELLFATLHYIVPPPR
jgi:hypothetical protein